MYGGIGLPAMGIRGIALATVLIQALGCFYLAWRDSVFQAEIPFDTSAMEAGFLSMGTVGQTGNTGFDQYDDGCCGHFL